MATLPCAGNTFGSDGHPWYLRGLLGENFTRRARTKFPPIQCNKTAVAGRPLGFLIDSGAAVSVVTYGVLPSSIRAEISNVAPIAIGANGSPLDVVGRVNIEITMDTFCTNHSFIVVQKLTVDCLLGMDFLAKHGAVIDCVKNSLSLTSGSAYLQLHETKKPVSDIVAVVSVSETVQISARSKGFVRGTITHPGIKAGQEGLVEPKYKGQGRLLVARSLNTVDPQNEVPIQVINTGHEPITLYSGMSIASFSSSVEIMSVSDKEHSPDNMQGDGMPDVDLAGANLSPSQKHDLNRLIWEFRDLFVSEGGCTGRTSVIKHTIRTEGSPIRQPLRRIPFVLQDTVKTEIKKMLQQGVIRKSCSPWSSPVVMIKKKDGAWRFCIDFRKVNSVTHKDAYPLPRIDETLESLSGSQYFTTLDLASGYWQVEVSESDKEKTAFSTRDGHYEFNVMPFGLTNAPATFQRLMECVLAGLTFEQCLIYLDDIVVFSATFPQHLERLRTVFEHLAHAGLKLKPNKCHFARSEIRYLGHIVSRDGVKADPEKLRAITSYPIPRDVKELRQFLGLANYYRRFIEGYSVIAEPLHKHTRKSAAGYKWTDECGRAFLALQQRLVSPPILAYPQFAHKFTLATDASDSALGGILSQVINGQERVISYWSRQLNKAELNYSTVEREALAVVAAVKEFYPYLYGRPFTLYTDHNPLTSLHGLKDTGGRLTRWLLYLQQFDMIVLYRPGRNNGNADGLSRRPEIYREQVSEVYGITCSVGDSEMLRQEQAKDAYTSEIIQKLQEGKHSAKLDDFLLEDGILVRQLKTSTCSNPYKQVVVPIALRQTILEQLHNNAGHLGIHKTFEKVKERFFWPGYEQDVKDAVQQCDRCQRRNHPIPKHQAPIGTISSEYPFQKISWDIIGPLPATTRGHKYILVVTDLFSKWVEAFPLVKTDSLTLAKVLVEEVVCRYGVPQYLHSDQGTNLVSDVIQSLCILLGIQRTQTTAYHPQGNGQVERFNRTLEAMLSKVVTENQKDWDDHLQSVLFAYRTAIHESTGYTPFLVMFGHSPSLPVDVMQGRVQHLKKKLPQYVQNVQRSLKDTFSSVRQHLDAAHQRQKLSADRSSTGESTFQVGDIVWLYIPAVKTGLSRKLSSLWRGPYTILDKVTAVNYKIQLIGGTKCQTVHSNRLKLYNGHPEPISRTEKNVGHSRPDQPDVASGHVMVEEEDGEEEDMIQEEAIREDVEEALVHGEEEAIIQEGPITNEDESGEDIGPEEEQIEISLPVKRYPQRIRNPPVRL